MANLKGTNRADILVGTTLADTITGRGGDDLLLGGSGSDVLNGGKDLDVLRGGTGRDFLYGGDGDDQLYGGAGADLLVGGRGADLLAGGNGEDIFLFDYATREGGYDTLTDFAVGDTLKFDGFNLQPFEFFMRFEQVGDDVLVSYVRDFKGVLFATDLVLVLNAAEDQVFDSADFSGSPV